MKSLRVLPLLFILCLALVAFAPQSVQAAAALPDITINTDGTYSFEALGTAQGGKQGLLNMRLTATDADNDNVGALAFVNVVPQGAPVLPNVSISESALINGTAPGNTDVAIAMPAGINLVFGAGWTEAQGTGWQLNRPGMHGYLLCDDAGTDSNGNRLGANLRYRLYSPVANSSVTGAAENSQHTDSYDDLVFSNGTNYWNVPMPVVIIDDEPVLDFTNGGGTATSGDAFSGSYSMYFGADGSGPNGGIELVATNAANKSGTFSMGVDAARDVVIDGVNYGKITFSQGQQFSFEAATNINDTLKLSLTVTDGDGDVTAAPTGYTLKIEMLKNPYINANLTGTVSDAGTQTLFQF